MRNITIKDNSLRVNKNTATITLEWNGHYTLTTEKQIKALAVLLGDYNRYGRNINLETHRKNIEDFSELLDRVTGQL